MSHPQPKNPLHGVTLAMVLTHLVDCYGWAELGRTIKIKCFTHNPGIKSSLTFLRKTPWARAKVEGLYLQSLDHKGPSK
ncbi:MAG: VF530 family protein [Acidiferrobacterales bacterium]